MEDQEHFSKLERMYLKANINTKLYDTTKIKIEKKESTITLDISENYFHALGAIHGSVYFKLLDDAAFFAVNSIVKDAFVLTTSFNINLLRPANKGTIKAIGKVTFESKQLFVAEATLYDQKGRIIGIGTGNFAKSKVALTEEIGYV